MSARNAPPAGKHRHSKSLHHLKNVQLNNVPAGRSNDNVFASLRATQLLGSQRAALPAELIDMILDYLPIPELMRFARVSHRLQEMVYDDTRWTQKLKSMGVWNDAEARQRFDESMKRKLDAQKARDTDNARRNSVLPHANGDAGGGRRHAGSVTLFDAGLEEDRYRKSLETAPTPSHRRAKTVTDGFEDLTLTTPTAMSRPITAGNLKPFDQNAALDVFTKVKSVRGHAREEFGKIYAALGPVYIDLMRSKSHADALIFKTYRDPEQQAQVLSNLKRFAQADFTQGAMRREAKLDSMIHVFENAVLGEFEQGYAANDVDGRMHRYAHVLVTLNGGVPGVEWYIASNPMLTGAVRLGNPFDCLESVASGHVDLNPSQSFFERLASAMIDQAAIIDRTFPPTVDVLTPLLSKICDKLLNEYFTTLFDEAHTLEVETYVKAVAGTFAQALRFVASLVPSKASPSDFAEQSKRAVTRCFEKHVELYLVEELTLFQRKSRDIVNRWEKDFSEQEASTESFFMSNISRQAAKRDFLSSFKKVVMMPVHVLPAFPMASPFASAKPATVVSKSSANLETVDTAYGGARPSTPTLSGLNTPNHRASTPIQEPPTTELAAKAAIMNARLEGIRSLFSIDIALSLTQLAKVSIERAALFVQMGGDFANQTKEQCGAMFVSLLHILGDRHVRHGFDKAVTHLGGYNPREVRKFREGVPTADHPAVDAQPGGVEPLVTFLELVNVGDLIQQMLDVFFAQELVSTKLIDRDDFLDPAVAEKKKFEQMLDERVAAGLNKGIDVLMDEVEFICATVQTPTDFNPELSAGATHIVDTTGPSAAATQVVDMVAGHTGMLVGSTDKTMLDVFTQEVGLRLFGVLCKHLKRQRVSVAGAIRLICDLNHYAAFAHGLKQKPLHPYYQALREMAQIYLVHIDPPGRAYFSSSSSATPPSGLSQYQQQQAAAAATSKRLSLLSTRASPTQQQARELATIIADTQRYHGIFPAEEVYEFAERRADWYLVKGDVERAMYGVGCTVM